MIRVLLSLLLGFNTALQSKHMLSSAMKESPSVIGKIGGLEVDESMISFLISFLAFILSIMFLFESESESIRGSKAALKKKKAYKGETVDVVIVGCGLPKRGMGWYHLTQLFDMETVSVAGVVEPFFANGKLCESPPPAWSEFATSLKEKDIPVVDSVSKLPVFQKTTICLIAGRTADNPALFKACIENGAKVIYLEKPGAPTVAELEEMSDFAKSKDVKVYLGYNKNVTPYVQKALAKAETVKDAHVEFVHNNSYDVNELNECFTRNAEGMMKNMAIHEMALLVSFFGVTVDTIAEFKTNKDKAITESLSVWVPGTAMPNEKYITDFSRIGFTVTTKENKSVTVRANRCGGNISHAAVKDASGVEVGKYITPDEDTQKKVDELCAADPEMMPYFFVQTDDYLELKERVVNSTLKGDDAKGVATIQIAIDALKLAEYCTEQVNKDLK